ncbi:MAG: hypothetical protein AAGK14_01275 [Verrucomicrobiota bacterium]
MKNYGLILPLLAGLLLGSLQAETIETLNGVVYEDVTVTGHDASTLHILHKNGGARIHFERLAPEYRKRYNYDPTKIWFENANWAKHVSAMSDLPIVAVFVERDSDRASEQLWQRVFNTRAFNRFAEGKFIRLLVDFPQTTPMEQDIREQNVAMKEEYLIEQMPVVMLLDFRGDIIGEIEVKFAKGGDAGMSTADMTASLETALAEHQAKLDAAKNPPEPPAESDAAGEAPGDSGSATASTASPR